MSADRDGLVVTPRPERAAVDAVGDRYVVLASTEETGGAYALLRAIVPPGGGPPMHVHERESERFDVLRGEITIFREGGRTVARPGDGVLAPRGVPHAFRNDTDEAAEMLIHVTPGGFDRFLLAFGRPARDGADPIAPPDDEQIRRLTALAPDYGITILGPTPP